MSRRLLACTAVTGLLAGSLAAVHALSPAADQRAAQQVTAETGDAARFLRLTGGSETGPTAVPAAQQAAPGAAVAAASCAKAAGTVATLPNGWCLSPAGANIDVLRFPLGVTPTSNGKVVVTSNSGGVQGLTVINQATLATSQTTAGNLFMGVAETADHRVYAAGGNANRARSWARAVRRWPEAQSDLLDLYRLIEVPVLLLWADEDAAHPVAIAEEALDLLPDAQLRVLDGTGFLMAYDDPVGLARELAAFCG